MDDNVIEIVNKDYIFELSQNSYDISVENVFSIDYNLASNIPSINNVKLTGNKSLSDLGIQSEGNYADNSLSNLSASGENHFANPSLSNLSSTGQAILDNKLKVDLSNLDTTGQAIINSKANNATTLNGYGITDGANISASNFNTHGKNFLSSLALPASSYVDLVFGASGSTYVAPENGYIYLQCINSANGPIFALLHNETTGILQQNQLCSSYGTIALCIPVVKDNSVALLYSNDVTCQIFRFIYTKGAQ